MVAALPNEIPWELAPPEGDAHRRAKERVLDALGAFFKRVGRRVYLSSEIGVYYPDEPRFVPDVLAVVDVEPHERQKWVVTAEGKGLDLVMEVLVAGDKTKDLSTNVERYARLGITEYFVFDRGRERLHGYRLVERRYQPIVPQEGRWPSSVLGLDLVLETGRVRFFFGTAPLLESDELLSRANVLLADVMQKREDAERRAEEEARRAEEGARRADEEVRRAREEVARREAAERALEGARAEIERLKRR